MSTKTKSLTIRWSMPVTVSIGHGHPEAISEPKEALRYLEHRWPLTTSEKIENARFRCEQAMNREISAQYAREVFISAAIEAGVYV